MRFKTSKDLASHWIVLLACFGILAGSLILSPPHPETHSVRLGTLSIPPTCTFRNLTGLPCPGCGLMRSMVSAIHGNVDASLSYHRLGLLTLAYIFLQLLYRMGLILIPSIASLPPRYGRYLDRGIIFIGILFGLNWILTLIFEVRPFIA